MPWFMCRSVLLWQSTCLANKVRADIRRLGEDAATNAREQRDARGAKAKARQAVERSPNPNCGLEEGLIKLLRSSGCTHVPSCSSVYRCLQTHRWTCKAAEA